MGVSASEQVARARSALAAVMKAETSLLELVLDTNRATNPEVIWAHLDKSERRAIEKRIALPIRLPDQK